MRAGVLGGLALGVVEIGGNRDDGLGDRLSRDSASAVSFILLQDEGGNLRGRILLAVRRHPGVAVGGLDDLVRAPGPCPSCVMGSSNDRPIRRLIAKKVRSGLVTPWRLAGWPTRRSPSSVKATIDGVVRAPSEFSMTFGVAAFHDRDAGVGGPEVDADDFCHLCRSFRFARPPDPEAIRFMDGCRTCRFDEADGRFPHAAEIGIPAAGCKSSRYIRTVVLRRKLSGAGRPGDPRFRSGRPCRRQARRPLT